MTKLYRFNHENILAVLGYVKHSYGYSTGMYMALSSNLQAPSYQQNN